VLCDKIPQIPSANKNKTKSYTKKDQFYTQKTRKDNRPELKAKELKCVLRWDLKAGSVGVGLTQF